MNEDARIRIANSTVDATTYRMCPAIGAGYHATGDATLEIIIENSNVIAKGGTLRSGSSGTYVPGIGKDSYSKWLNVKIQITDSTVESLRHTEQWEEPDDYRIYDGLHEKNLPGIPETMTLMHTANAVSAGNTIWDTAMKRGFCAFPGLKTAYSTEAKRS